MTVQIRMLDVSANNHGDGRPIDWQAVKAAGYGAAMIKASEGASYQNPWRAQDGDAAHRQLGLAGYYHFAHPGQNAPATEAAFALAAINGLPRNMGLALDLEVTEGRSWEQLSSWASAFAEDVSRHVEHCPLYLNDYFLANLPGVSLWPRLWLAQTARPRRKVWAWQETTPASVPGIVGGTDVGWLHPDE